MNTHAKIELPKPFRVGDWNVDPSSGRLVKSGLEIKLEPKVMQVLVYLAQHQGKVISREALEAEAWAGTIVGYDAVSGSIIKLRKALGDSSRQPRYIETISKKGYRLIAPVSSADEDVAAPDISQEKKTPLGSESSPVTNMIRKNLFLGAGLALIAVLLTFVILNNHTESQSSDVAATPSVVVLPFKNLSDDPQQEYLSDGITDDLITDLSRIDTVRVIARQSSYHYKQFPADTDTIASQLQVTYIVEGSVRKSGDDIRINVQLTDTTRHQSIWAQRFDTDTRHIFNMQDDITKNVMDAMLVKVPNNKANDIQVRDTNNFEAYDAFLMGQKYIGMRTKQGYDQAIKAYRRALQIDPNYARVYGAMAVTLTRGYRYLWTDLALVEARERALELATKAAQLNPTSPQIFWAMGYVRLHRHEYNEALSAAEKSVALSPNYADGYALLANIANWRGKPNDAVRNIQKAINLNPHHTFQYPSTLGLALYYLGRYQDAIPVLREAIASNESALNPRLFLAATLVRLGQLDDAAWEIEQVKATRPDVTVSNLDTTLPFESDTYLKPLLDDLRKAGLRSS